MGFRKSYVIFRVGHGKCLRPITRWVGGVKKGPKPAYVIFEWSLRPTLVVNPRENIMGDCIQNFSPQFDYRPDAEIHAKLS